MIVVCLCAAWCDTCTEFRVAFDRIAAARPGMRFVWLDIEDDSDICGDIDVENFPTLAIYRGETLLHFGVSLPQEGTVARLIDAMAVRAAAAATATTSVAPQAVLQLPQRLPPQR
ncbi:MAG: thioredoxin family protein [Burkholderiales bacterium]|jgi:thioredoxin reductase (NADPH)